MAKVVVPGSRLFARFLEKNRIRPADAARALRVARSAVQQWLDEIQRPKQALRERIERWTGGDVPAVSWSTKEEREAVDHVVPFKKSGTEG